MQFVPSLREVHAWLTRDESFLATSDKGAFVKHQTAPKFESLYRSSALPVHAWSADGSGRYDFQPMGRAVLQLRCCPPLPACLHDAVLNDYSISVGSPAIHNFLILEPLSYTWVPQGPLV